MTKKEFETKFPLVLFWIQNILTHHARRARAVVSLGFERLPLYFSPDVLETAKVVYVDAVPMPPLKELGFDQFSEFQRMELEGITFVDTFFSLKKMRGNESHHFHELVHVIQWQVLGPETFLAAYADGLERAGYRQSPLEVMAYCLESVFRNSQNPFNAVRVVREQLLELYPAG